MGAPDLPQQTTLAHEQAENGWTLTRTVIDAVVQIEVPGVVLLLVLTAAALPYLAKMAAAFWNRKGKD